MPSFVSGSGKRSRELGFDHIVEVVSTDNNVEDTALSGHLSVDTYGLGNAFPSRVLVESLQQCRIGGEHSGERLRDVVLSRSVMTLRPVTIKADEE